MRILIIVFFLAFISFKDVRAQESFIPVPVESGRIGLKDSTGTEILDTLFYAIYPDVQFIWAIPFDSIDIGDPAEENMGFTGFNYNLTGQWQLYDRKGNRMNNFQFAVPGIKRKGNVYEVKSKSGFGLIDSKANFIIKMNNSSFRFVRENLILTEKQLFDEKGKPLYSARVNEQLYSIGESAFSFFNGEISVWQGSRFVKLMDYIKNRNNTLEPLFDPIYKVITRTAEVGEDYFLKQIGVDRKAWDSFSLKQKLFSYKLLVKMLEHSLQPASVAEDGALYEEDAINSIAMGIFTTDSFDFYLRRPMVSGILFDAQLLYFDGTMASVFYKSDDYSTNGYRAYHNESGHIETYYFAKDTLRKLTRSAILDFEGAKELLTASVIDWMVDSEEDDGVVLDVEGFLEGAEYVLTPESMLLFYVKESGFEGQRMVNVEHLEIPLNDVNAYLRKLPGK